MNKTEFLETIRHKLQEIPPEDLQRSLDYYSEMIDDRMEEGLPEEEAVAAMGTPEEIAGQILAVAPQGEKIHLRRSLHLWEILLLVLGSPVWVPLLLAAIIILLAVYIVIWAAVTVFYAADLTIAAGAITGLASSIVSALTGKFAQAILFLGAGLFCTGLAILLFFAFNKITAGLLKFTGLMIQKMKGRFVRKEGSK